jgi:hypothetical protein
MLQPPLNAPPTDQPLPKAQQPGSDPRREIASLPPLSAWLAKKHRNENKSLVAFKYALRFFWCALDHTCHTLCVQAVPQRPNTAYTPLLRQSTSVNTASVGSTTSRVDDASGYLHYSTSERKGPSFSLDLTSVKSVVPSTQPESERVTYTTDRGLRSTKNHTSAAFGLEIVTDSPQANLHICALSSEAAQTWVYGLQARAGLSCGLSPSVLDAGSSRRDDATTEDGSQLRPWSPKTPPGIMPQVSLTLAQGWLHKHNSPRGAIVSSEPLGSSLGAKPGTWSRRYFRLDAGGTLCYMVRPRSI